MHNEYYLQDSKNTVGNDMLFWAKDGKGYTTDLSKAHVYTKDEAVSQHQCRETDIPWPKDYIDEKTRTTIDVQYVSIKEALNDAGVTLIEPQKPKKGQHKCYICGVFMSGIQYHSSPCNKCGYDNRP